MKTYEAPKQLKLAVSSEAPQQALLEMFDARLAFLHGALETAERMEDIYRLQGSIREAKALRSSFLINSH